MKKKIIKSEKITLTLEYTDWYSIEDRGLYFPDGFNF